MSKTLRSFLSLQSQNAVYRSSKLFYSNESSSETSLFIREVSNRLQNKSSSNSNRRVVITGAGTISPLGSDVLTVYEKCLGGYSGIKSIRDYYVKDENGKNWSDEYIKHGVQNFGFISQIDRSQCDKVCGGQERVKSEAMKFAEFASIKAFENANWNPTSSVDKWRTGVCLGNSMVDLDYIASAHNLITNGKGRKVSPFFIPRILCNMAAGHVAIKFGLRGPNHAVSTACSTGSHAIGDAFNFIRNNNADVMLAGGSDTCINPLSIIGFSRARALSTKFKDCPEKASRPFDKDRDGFVMAEGAAVLVLEELEHALKRNAEIICEIVGYGASCDADHITAGLEDGSGAFLAIMDALAALPKNISNELWLINAHATSTPRGDFAEMNAIRKCLNLLKEFQEDWSQIKVPENGPFVTAHKSNLGHMIGAAGAMESAMAALSLKNGKVPGILNLDNPEENIDEQVNLLQSSIDNPKTNCDRRLVLKNSFGFGGTNVSLVLAEYID